MNNLYLPSKRASKTSRAAYKFARQILVLAASFSLIFAPLPSLAQNPVAASIIAGQVIFTAGDVYAQDTSGANRPLSRRSEVWVGDTLYTGPNASTQIRMVDSAVISLKKLTVFSIVAYEYDEGNPETESVSLELVEGGFRTITGTIGKQNKEAYEARVANFATVGIRGTDYEVMISEAGEMLAGIYDGGITLSNDAGSLDLGIGVDFDFARVENEDTPPEGLLIQAPELGIILIDDTDEDQNEDENQEDESSVADNDDGSDDSQNSNTSTDDGSDNQSSDSATTGAGIATNNPGSSTSSSENEPALTATTSTRAPTVITTTGILNTAASAEANTDSSSLVASINPNELGSGLVACSGSGAACQDGTTDPEESDSGITIETGDDAADSDNDSAVDGSDSTPDNSGNDNSDNGTDNGNSGNDNGNNGNGNDDSAVDDTDSTPGNSGNDNSDNGTDNGNSGNDNGNNGNGNDDSVGDDTDSTPGNSGNDNSDNGNGNGNSGNDNGNNGNGNDDSVGDDTDSTPGNPGNDNSDNGNGNSGNDNGNNGNGNDDSVGDDTDTDSTPGNSGNDNSGNGNSGNGNGNGNSDDDDDDDDNSNNGNGNNGNNGNGNNGNGNQTDTLSRPENSVDQHDITWGRWDNAASSNWVVIDSIGESKIRLTSGEYAAEFIPSDISKLSGSFVYGTNIASSFIGHGSAGAIDSLIAQMNIEFDTGQISDGVLQVLTGNQTWDIDFSGAINQGAVQLNGINGVLSDSTGILSTKLSSSLGGTFTGENAEAFVGGFNLIDANNPASFVQGLYTIER